MSAKPERPNDLVGDVLTDSLLPLNCAEMDFDEPLDLGLGFDVGNAGFSKWVRDDSSAACEWSGEYYGDELLKDRFLYLDDDVFDSNNAKYLQRPSKRARSDWLDGLLALLD